MVRVKRGKAARKKKKRLFKQVKGFRWGRKRRLKLAKDALRHAWTHAYRDRKRKKREMRKLWQTQISAACRKEGMNYSKFIHGLKENNISLNRKILAQLAISHHDIFKKIVEKVKKPG